MIIQIRIGTDVDVLMDDEITDSRPTPEVVADYLTRLGAQAVKTYSDLPAGRDVGQD